MPVNQSIAPVCYVSRSQVPIARPAVPIAIPPPTDLPSAIRAINQLISIYNPTSTQNNLVEYPYLPRWHEIHRDTTIVRIKNPKDPEMWVDVERITNLVFHDRTSDQLFQWLYNPPPR
jgi:hypothetical protein